MTKISNIHVSFCAAMVVSLSAPQLASAQSSSSLSGLFACEVISNSEAQLSCFMAETAKLRAGEQSGEIIAVEKSRFEEIKKAEVKALELEEYEQKKAKAPKSRTLAIRSAAPGTKGYMRFTLENGEVWQQIESGKVRLGKGAPDVLVIKKKSFGSFLGRVNDKRPSFRVRQVE